MDFEEKCTLLSAVSKPYDFNGISGVSNKIRLNIGGEIYVANATEDQVSQYVKFEGKNGIALLKFTSPKEKLKLSLVSFKE